MKACLDRTCLPGTSLRKKISVLSAHILLDWVVLISAPRANGSPLPKHSRRPVGAFTSCTVPDVMAKPELATEKTPAAICPSPRIFRECGLLFPRQSASLSGEFQVLPWPPGHCSRNRKFRLLRTTFVPCMRQIRKRHSQKPGHSHEPKYSVSPVISSNACCRSTWPGRSADYARQRRGGAQAGFGSASFESAHYAYVDSAGCQQDSFRPRWRSYFVGHAHFYANSQIRFGLRRQSA